MLRAREYGVLSNQYAERSAYTNVFKYNRENKRFERAKVNSRCFHWFPVAMLESLRGATTWRLLTKPYNFQWNLLPNNSSSEYRASPKLWHVVYLLLVYDISISWLNILNGKRCYFSLAWWLNLLAWRESHQLPVFLLMSLKFKLQNYWCSWDFTFMIYKNYWKLII